MGYLNLGSITLKKLRETPASGSRAGNMLAEVFQNYNEQLEGAIDGRVVSLDYKKIGLATITAVVESSAYTFLMIGAWIAPRQFNETSVSYYFCLRSSSFSIGWAIIAGITAKLYRIKVPDREPLARFHASHAWPYCLRWCYRPVDSAYLSLVEVFNRGVKDQKKNTTDLMIWSLTPFLPIEKKNSEILDACRSKDRSIFPWLIFRVIGELIGNAEYITTVELSQETCDAIVEKRLDAEFQSLLKQVREDPVLSESFQKVLKLSPMEFAQFDFADLPTPVRSIVNTFRFIADLEGSGVSGLAECLSKAMEEIDRKRVDYEQRDREFREMTERLDQQRAEWQRRHQDFLTRMKDKDHSGFEECHSRKPVIKSQTPRVEYVSIRVGELCAVITTTDGETISIPHTKFRNALNRSEDPEMTFKRFEASYDRFNYVITFGGCLEIWPQWRASAINTSC